MRDMILRRMYIIAVLSLYLAIQWFIILYAYHTEVLKGNIEINPSFILQYSSPRLQINILAICSVRS